MSQGPPCWLRERDASWMEMKAATYFAEVKQGVHCNTNWYEGNMNWLGRFTPTFNHPAPALLGFDDSIDRACHGSSPDDHATACVRNNLNILSLYGDRVPYNICRNLEWQVCAAIGQIPGQGGKTILFAKAPKELFPDEDNGKGLGQCEGWVPAQRPVGGIYGYATVDIFYLEVCLVRLPPASHQHSLLLFLAQALVFRQHHLCCACSSTRSAAMERSYSAWSRTRTGSASFRRAGLTNCSRCCCSHQLSHPGQGSATRRAK